MSEPNSYEKRSLAARALAGHQREVRGFRLFERIDPLMMICLLTALVIISIVWFLLIGMGSNYDYFDPPLCRKLSDERWIDNIWGNDDAVETLLDATYHSKDQRIYISQEGGVIHSYHPPTHLWSTERPFKNGEGIDTDFSMIRSGNGIVPRTFEQGYSPQKDLIWAVSQNGGLACRKSGNWNIVYGDSRFETIAGLAISHDDLTSAAFSPDGKWLVVGTRSEGIGVYNALTRSWMKGRSEYDDILNSGKISDIVWWQDSFWIGGDSGLVSIRIKNHLGQLEVMRQTSGTVLDLAVDPQVCLLALVQKECEDSSSHAIWLGRWDLNEPNPLVLLDEKQVYSELSLTNLVFAQQLGNKLVLAGTAGIFTYDLTIHSWARHLESAVVMAESCYDGQGFCFATWSNIGFFDPENVEQSNYEPRLWEIPNKQQITQLLNSPDNEVFASTVNGYVYAVKLPDGKLQTVYRPSSTSFDVTRLREAVNLGDIIMFLGPEGALLHNISSRSYVDIAERKLPHSFRKDDKSLCRSGDHVFLVNEIQGNTKVEVLPISQLQTGDLTPNQDPFEVVGKARQVWNWADQGVGILFDSGEVHRFQTGSTSMLVGPAAKELRGRIRGFAETQYGAVVLGKSNILRYDYDSRNWSEWAQGLSAQTVNKLISSSNIILALADDNQLFKTGSQAKLIIGGPRISVTDHGFSDFFDMNGEWFLAGNAHIDLYDSENRYVVDRWSPPVNGSIDLVGVIADLPVAIGDQQLIHGSQIIDNAAGDVHGAFFWGDTLWVVRDEFGQRSLVSYRSDVDGNLVRTTCLFKQPKLPPEVTRIENACEVDKNTAAVATDAGLWFYSSEARSWQSSNAEFMKLGGQVFRTAKNLVMLGNHNDGIRFAVTPIESLSATSVSIETPISIPKPAKAKSLTVSANNEIAWIDSDGAVIVRVDDTTTTRLESPTIGPASSDLQRVHSAKGRTNQAVWLTTRTGELWKYNMRHKRWHNIRLVFPPGITCSNAELNLTSDRERPLLTIHTRAGLILEGIVTNEDSVTLRIIYTPPIETFAHAASDVLDVVALEPHCWTFLLEDRLRTYNAAERAWKSDVLFSNRTHRRELALAGERAVIVEHTSKGDVWHIAKEQSSLSVSLSSHQTKPGDLTAIEEQGAIIRLTTGGELLRAELPEKGPFKSEDFVRLSTPLLINPKDVRASYNWLGFKLFDTIDGLRCIKWPSQNEIALPVKIQNLGNVHTVRVIANRLWLVSESSACFLELGDQGKLETEFLQGVSRVLVDDSDRIWLRRDGDWWYQGDDEPIRVNADKSHLTRDSSIVIRALPCEGAPIVGIGSDRHVYEGNNLSLRDSFALPLEMVNDSLTTIVRGSYEDWWVIAGSHICHLERKLGEDDCYSIDSSISLPPSSDSNGKNAVQAVISHEDKQLIVLDYAGKTHKIVTHSGSCQIQTHENETPLSGVLHNEWSTDTGLVRLLPNGEWALDPIISLEVETSGKIFTRRPSGVDTIAEKGVMELTQTKSMDAGWLRWQRSKKSFQYLDETRWKDLSLDTFIPDDYLIFEKISAVVADTISGIRAANPHGIWHFQDSRLSLVDSMVRFQPVSMMNPIRAVHNGFLTPEGQFSANGSSIRNARSHVVEVGDVSFVEEHDNVTIKIATDNGTIAGYSGNSFVWDQNRRALAFIDGKLFIQSNAGIHSLDNYRDFSLGPEGKAHQEGRLQGGNRPLFLVSDRWFEYSNSKWNRHGSNPWLDCTFIDNAHWRWETVNSNLIVRLTQSNEVLDFDRQNGGFGFKSDRLVDANAIVNRLFVVTQSWLEEAYKLEELSNHTAIRQASVLCDKLVTFRTTPDSIDLYKHYRGQYTRWDESSRRFLDVSPTLNPFIKHILYNDGRLRLTWQSNQIIKELAVDLIEGGQQWIDFNFKNGEFPFDVVTSITSVDNRLLVGSQAGLQVYPTSANTSWSKLASLVHPALDVTSELVPVTELGHPHDTPRTVVMTSERGCFTMSNGKPFTPCQKANPLKQEFISHRDGFWTWWYDKNNGLQGQYLDSQGHQAGEQIAIANGRFPHDLIRQITVFDGRAFELRSDGWVTEHTKYQIDIGSIKYCHTSPTNSPIIQLINVPTNTWIKNVYVTRGLYARDSRNTIIEYNGRDWQLVKDKSLANAVNEFRRNPPIFAKDRFRLLQRTESDPFCFEQRDSRNTWHKLPWKNGRLTIDHWVGMLPGRELWVGTQEGVINLQRTTTGEAWLDASTFRIQRTPTNGSKDLLVTKFMRHEGKVVCLCDDDTTKLYECSFSDSLENNCLVSYSGANPFTSRQLIGGGENDFLNWFNSNRSPGDEGILSAFLNDRSVELMQGHFSYDNLRTLAPFQSESVDVSTVAGGWFRIPRDSWHVREFRAPNISGINSAAIRWVAKGRLIDEPVLCLADEDDSFNLLHHDGRVERTQLALEHLCEAGVWRYTRSRDSELIIDTQVSIGGRAIRELEEGRFTDNVVIGLPITTHIAGSMGHMVPTQTGIVQLDSTMKTVLIHSPEFPGLTDGVVPSVLHLNPDFGLVYLSEQGLRTIDNGREVVVTLEGLEAIEDVASLQSGPENWLLLNHSINNKRCWSLLFPKQNGNWRIDKYCAAVSIEGFAKYQENRAKWQLESPPNIWLTIGDNEVILEGLFQNNAYNIDLKPGVDVVRSFVVDDRMLVFGRNYMWDIDLGIATAEVVEQALSK